MNCRDLELKSVSFFQPSFPCLLTSKLIYSATSKECDVATKAPLCLNLEQNGHFIENRWSDFYETFRNVFFDLKQIHNSYKINKIRCKIKYLTQIVIFRPFHRPPLSDLVFWAALCHVLADFNKKRCQNAQWIILHH